MSLEVGQKLAHYEIGALLGKGGMGEVFRAKDTKLGREVAIKVLPEAFSQDDERLRRFRREAKVLASLNHPNIASIYELAQEGTTHYLVLELVQGETLQERLLPGPIPVEEALAIAAKIGAALEAAHEHGIVHRDLKPANIKLTPDDDVKVLDFGLAKAFAEEAPESDNSLSPTRLRQGSGEAGTQVGVILGTAAYMSPEQAKGKRVDKRADVWAFGAVVYEMLTGRKAFEGEDVSDTLAAVLRAEPDLAALPADASPALRKALARCLEKDLKRRLRDVGDVRLAMEGAFAAAVPPPAASGSRWRVLSYVLASAFVTGLALWVLTRAPLPPRSVARFVVTGAPSPSFSAPGEQHQLALSPDGSRVVYRAGFGGNQTWLYARPLDALEATRLEGTQADASPFFSPDGAWIGFLDGRTLKKIPASGGTAVTIAELSSGVRGASWGDDGTIVFATTRALYRVSAAGGEPEILLEPTRGSNEVFRWPELLPGGRAVLFTIQVGRVELRIAVLDLETSKVRPLVSPGTYPRYARTGHIVYGGGDGTLRAVRFDADRLEVTGDPVAVFEGVVTRAEGATAFALSANGALIYAPGSARRETRLVWVDRGGREALLDIEPRTFDYPRLSPDGNRIAVKIGDGGSSDLFVVDLERGTLARLTRIPEGVTNPMWSRDATALIFGSSRDGGGLFQIAADGAGDVVPLGAGFGGTPPLPGGFSTDGDRIVFYESGGPAIGDIFTFDTKTSEVEALLASPEVQEAHPAVSPDGHWLAYTGNDSGRMEIYVRPFPNVSGRRVLISPDGGNEPAFRDDGRELYYWDDRARSMMAVPITLEPTFRAGTAKPLFEGDYIFYREGRHYDVSADGERFLMIRAGSGKDESALGEGQLVYVENWFTELERLVPAGEP